MAPSLWSPPILTPSTRPSPQACGRPTGNCRSRASHASPGPAAIDRARALLYRAELAVRVGDAELARASLASVRSMALNEGELEAIAGDLAHASELVGESKRS